VEAFVIALIIAAIVVIPRLLLSGGVRRYDKLTAGGIPARGILLQVANTSTRQTIGMRRFESRWVWIDVEVPGHPPYEIQTNAMIPSTFARDVLPGVTVEVRVDPANSKNIAIIGPGVGFSGGAQLAGPQPMR
jgi:hypothetical protein